MHTTMRRISMSWLLVAAALLLICLLVVDSGTIPGQWRTSTPETLDMEPLPEPLPTETIEVQGLARTVRFYIPADIPDDPALIIALHGGGDGARFRRLTNRAFESVAEKNGLVIAYPDGLGGQWYEDRSPDDGTRVEAHRWVSAGDTEVLWMIVRGGGHTLPHRKGSFPVSLTGKTSHDVDGASEIWKFFARQLPAGPETFSNRERGDRGLIVREWEQMDSLGLLQQLGALDER